MKITVRRWGNSLAIRIPKLFALKLGITSGKDMCIDATEDSLVLSHPTETLSQLLERVLPENIHGETDTGTPTGAEQW